MKQPRNDKKPDDPREPTVAPGLETDELEASASPQEVRNNDYTPVTKLFLDRVE